MLGGQLVEALARVEEVAGPREQQPARLGRRRLLDRVLAQVGATLAVRALARLVWRMMYHCWMKVSVLFQQ